MKFQIQVTGLISIPKYNIIAPDIDMYVGMDVPQQEDNCIELLQKKH